MQTDTLAVATAHPAAAGIDSRFRTAWGAIAVLGLTILSASTMRTLFSPVQEVAKQELGFTDVQLSLLQGLAISIPIAVLALPLGRLTDRVNRVRLLAAMAAIWTAGTVLTAFVDGFAMLFVARMLAGLGALCAVPVVISLASDFCRPEIRGRAMMPLSMGINVGTALSFALGGGVYALLAAGGGIDILGLSAWRAMHVIFGLVSALLVLPLLFFREPARHEVAEAGIGFGPALREIWDRRAFLGPLFLGQVGVVMADVAATIWAAPVLTRHYGLQPADFSGWVGLVLLGSGLLGAVLGGFAADLGQKLKRRGGILTGAVIFAALSIPGALYPIMPTATGFAWMLLLFMLSGAVAGLVTATALAVLVPNEIRGLCLGAFIVVGAVVGFGVGPTLVALVSQLLGGEAKIDLALALSGAAISAVSFLGFVAAMLKAPRSIEQV